MTAQPIDPRDQGDEPYEMIHLGGETAVVVPLTDYRRLRGLERRASEEDMDQAEAEAAGQDYRDWVAAGRPGEVSHEEAVKLLLGYNP